MLNYNMTKVCVAALLAGVFTNAGSTQADIAKDVITDEDKLIAILESEAPEADKALTCKRLAVFGSEKAVPTIKPLLANERLTSWARIALEAIPGEGSKAALREALDEVQGRVLVGVINSVAVKRDEKAVGKLAEKLSGDDVDVASAAAVALGHIGDEESTKTLVESLDDAKNDVRTAVAIGCILCAEQQFEAGNLSEAMKLYDKVRSVELPQQRILEATRGAILSRGDEGIPLLVEQLQAEDKELFGLGLRVSREIEGEELTNALASELQNVKPDRQEYIILALADRHDKAVLPIILQNAKSGEKNVRRVAIESLGQVGNASCLPTLLDAASSGEEQLTSAAMNALQELPGDTVDSEVKSRLDQKNDKTKKALIELVGLRRIDAIPELVKAIEDADADIRSAALTSLGATVKADDLGVLVARLLSKKYPEDTAIAKKALLTASIRMPDPNVCAKQLAGGLSGGTVETKCDFIEILGSVGGTQALREIEMAAKDPDDRIKDAASEQLGKWMTQDAAPVLLGLAEPVADDKYTVRALRGYLRIARQFKLPMEERIEMCRNALKVAGRDPEKQLVLQILERYASLPSLQLVVEAAKSPQLKDEATKTALAIAQKVGSDSEEVKRLLAQIDFKPVDVEIMKAVYGAGSNSRDVTEIVKRGIGELPVISLPASSFNKSLGGDPAPGEVKTLTVQYKMDGVPGEVVFEENATLVLPKPRGK